MKRSRRRAVWRLPGPGYDFSSARAGVAHLVERDLAKVEVAGSKPVSRSSFTLASLDFSCPGRRAPLNIVRRSRPGLSSFALPAFYLDRLLLCPVHDVP